MMANYVVAAKQRVSAKSPSRRAVAGHLQGIPAAPEGWQLIPGRDVLEPLQIAPKGSN
jgi:hypothetical protein